MLLRKGLDGVNTGSPQKPGFCGVSRLKKIFSAKAPDSLFAMIANVYWRLHPNRDMSVVRCGAFWLVRCGSERFFSTSPKIGAEYTRQIIMEKYNLRPFVEVDNGDIVFDVGGCIGGFTLAVAEKARRIFAIEPDPNNFLCLHKNTEGLKNVTIIQKALYNRTTKVKLNICVKPLSFSFQIFKIWASVNF